MSSDPPVEPALAVHPLNGAPDLAALAEFDAGRPDQDRADTAADTATDTATDAATAHIARCAECQAVLSGLRAVRADVAGLAGPPMPAAVADRIAAALAAEPGAETGAERGAASTPVGSDSGRHRAAEVIQLRSARRMQRLRVGAGLAAGIVLLGGGGYLVTNLAGAGGGQDAATSADSGGQEAADDGAGTLSVPGYDRQSLEAAAGDLLAGERDTASGGGPVPETLSEGEGEEQGAGGTDVDADCLASIPVVTAEALLITRVIYEGQPAIVVLFPGEPGRVDVTVLSDCADGEPATVRDVFDAER